MILGFGPVTILRKIYGQNARLREETFILHEKAAAMFYLKSFWWGLSMKLC